VAIGAAAGKANHGQEGAGWLEPEPIAVYALLDRLVAAGHISVRTEQEGNRPLRKVYTLTPTGETLFDDLLRENVSALDPGTGFGDIGLMFLGYLPPTEAVACLRRRLARLDAALDAAPVAPPHDGRVSVDLALAHQAALRQADRAWLAALLRRLDGPATAPGVDRSG